MRTRGGRFATIDGLRGIAILLVVWFHVWQITWQSATVPLIALSLQPLAETGFIGVALFFFISGFVLTHPYVRAHAEGTPPPSLRQFVLRRFFKIVPSYMLCIAALLAIGYQTYPNAFAALRDVALHLVFVHNWFAATSGSIDGVMWSLGAEVQFYVLFPLIVYAFVRRPAIVVPALLAIAIGWRAWCLASDHYFLSQRMQQLPAYLDFFAAGMTGAWAYTAIARRPLLARRAWAFTALALAGLAGIVAVAGAYYDHRFDPEWPNRSEPYLRPALALASLAAGLGSLFATRVLQRILANPALLFLAAISYNLYLWHQPIARVLVHLRVPPIATADPHDDRVWQVAFWFVAVPAVLAISAALTYAVERPLMRWGKRLEPTSRRPPASRALRDAGSA